MNILFDFEIEQKLERLPLFPISDQLEDAMFEIMDFIATRIKVLDSEMNKYPTGTTVVYVYLERDRPIIHHNYPADLTEKLDSCVNQQDFEYLLKKVEVILKSNLLPPSN